MTTTDTWRNNINNKQRNTREKEKKNPHNETKGTRNKYMQRVQLTNVPRGGRGKKNS